jgi:pimeloyl-ACP methyl ester carboxylesterase/heme-degrading monooxygenase HmoA
MKPVRFYNVWRTKTPEDQRSLIESMREKTAMFASKRGFISLIVSKSAEDGRVMAEGLWATEEDFTNAVTNNPEAHSGREQMEAFGVPEPGLFLEAFSVKPSISDPATLEALRAGAKNRWAELGFRTRVAELEGTQLHVAEAGTGDLLILLHGYPQSGEVWRHLAPTLAKTHTVVIPDLRGMGLSALPAGGYDLSTVAADIYRLAQQTGHKQFKIVGHDWGAAVGAVLALQHRSEVTKLVFIESAVAGCGFENLWNFGTPNPVMSFIPFLLMGDANPNSDITANLLQGREELFLQHLWQTFTGDKETLPFQNWARYVSAMARPGLASASASYYRSAYTSAEQARALVTNKLELPVLAIAGQKGIGIHHRSFVEAFAHRVHSDLILDGAGHFIPEERPHETLAAITPYLAE